jgi:3-oxoadipate enol-lactonase
MCFVGWNLPFEKGRTMPTYQTPDGCSLHYEFDDVDRDLTVVFLNGMTQSTSHWNRQAKAFAEHFSVLRYDARGQGSSDVGDRELTLDQHADDLDGMFDDIGIDSAHLVGFSHGARIALGFANRHPERLDKLVLCSATAEPTALARTIVRGWKGVLDSGAGLEGLAWASLPTILGNDFLANNEGILDGIVRATVQRNSLEGVRALLDAMIAYPDLAELAEGVSSPTRVLSADEDLLVTSSGAQKLAEIAGGDWVELEGVGHTIPIEAPEAFRSAVLSFLDA